jgi:hypothetical protein
VNTYFGTASVVLSSPNQFCATTSAAAALIATSRFGFVSFAIRLTHPAGTERRDDVVGTESHGVDCRCTGHAPPTLLTPPPTRAP